MKRLWIVGGILFFILGVSGLGLWHLSHVTKEMQSSLEQISTAVEQKNSSQTQILTTAFEEEWHRNEAIMVRYIHHESLDSVNGLVARLPALARHEQYPALAAEVAQVSELLAHICEAEFPNWKNIF